MNANSPHSARTTTIRKSAFRIVVLAGGIVLLAIAAFLRHRGCFTFPYFGDEPFTLSWSRDYQEFFRTGEPVGVVRSLKYPLVFAMNAFILDYFEDSVVAIRAIPFAAGVLVFPLFMWFLARRFGLLVMFVSLTVLAFNPTHIYFSQMGRYYSVVFLFANVALYAFFVSIERRSWRLFLVSQLFGMLAFLSHPGAGLLVTAECAYILVLGLYAWLEGRPFLPKRDAFSMTVAGVFGAACLALLVASLVILSQWSGISAHQANYDVVTYFSGTVLRIGIPLLTFAGVASLYYFLRRDPTGVFFSLALLCPLATGAILSLLGMEVNPKYVCFAIFPACVLVAYFLSELFVTASQLNVDSGFRAYSVALLVGSTVVMALGSPAALASYYIDGNRVDVDAAMRWIENERAGKGGIVITSGIALPIHFCRSEGISYEHLPRDSALNQVVDSVDENNVVVMSYVWWAALSQDDFARIEGVPHWLILDAERDGLTPDAPGTIRILASNEYKKAKRNPAKALKDHYRLEKRIGKTRLDHRQNYLLIYGPNR